MSDACRSCDAPVRWVKMARTGKPNPLDPEPAEDGNVAIRKSDGTGVVLTGDNLALARQQGILLYLSHFATCPDRQAWREDPNGSRLHTCPWPGCTERVPRQLWGCARHWRQLPAELRERCSLAWRAGTAAEHFATLEAIDEWISTQPIQGSLL